MFWLIIAISLEKKFTTSTYLIFITRNNSISVYKPLAIVNNFNMKMI